jgi:hypothetical protein
MTASVLISPLAASWAAPDRGHDAYGSTFARLSTATVPVTAGLDMLWVPN